MGLDAIVIRRLRRTELPIDTVELARELVGRVLAHDLPEGRVSGRIVETEAYVVGDASGHAFHGPTPRNRSLFLERGHAYVYRAYGISYLLNVSSELPGVGAGVLLRALEPVQGIEAIMRHRGTSRILDLARGPGRLAAAMRIDQRCDGADLCADGPLWLGAVAQPAGPIDRSVRIGLTLEVDRLLRFYERGNRFVEITELVEHEHSYCLWQFSAPSPLASASASRAIRKRSLPVLIGEPVPEFSLPPVQGRTLGLSNADLEGEVSLVNVFASWCTACRYEHPLFMRLEQAGVVPIHGLNYKDRPEDAAKWLDDLDGPYTRTSADLDGRGGIE